MLLILISISLILGPLGQVPLGIADVKLYLSDLIAGTLMIYWFTRPSQLFTIVSKTVFTKYFFAYVAVAVISLLVSPIPLTFEQRSVAFLYILRLMAYFFFYPTIQSLIQSKRITAQKVYQTLIVSGVLLSLLGWLQYLLYPDLRNLFYLGWDPHLWRIFGTYFDPNFLGLILVMTIILIFRSHHLGGVASHFQVPPHRESPFWPLPVCLNRFFVIGIFVFITLLFTYSRGSYLALVVAALYWTFAKRRLWQFGVFIVALIVALFLLPRPGGHGVLLERVFSIEQRIENFRDGLTIFSDHPVLGVGFNSVRYAKRTYGNKADDLIKDHAGAGFDNSLLFVGVTTGIVGLVIYILFLLNTFGSLTILGKTTLVASLVHAMFVNSLFYPWVMLWLWVVIAADSFRVNKKP